MSHLTCLEITEGIDGRENDPLTGNIIGAAIDVHRALGLGLLESAYEVCLVYELRLRQLLSYLRLYGGYSKAAH